MQRIAITQCQIGARSAIAIGRQPYAARARRTRLADGQNREWRGEAIDLSQHNIVCTTARAGPAHITDKDIVAIVDNHARKGRVAALGGAHFSIVDNERRLPSAAAIRRIGEVDVLFALAIGRRNKGVGHARMATAIDLQIQGRKRATCAIRRQGMIGNIAADGDGRAKGIAAVKTARIHNPIERRAAAGIGKGRTRRSSGLFDPRHMDSRMCRCARQTRCRSFRIDAKRHDIDHRHIQLHAIGVDRADLHTLL